MNLKLLTVLLATIIAVLMIPAQPADAGPTVASTVTLGAATGSGAFTNDMDYYTLAPISIEVFNDKCLTNVVTVQRVRSARTNTVCALTLAGGAGIYYSTNTLYLFKNDVWLFTSSVSTGGTAEVLFEQKR